MMISFVSFTLLSTLQRSRAKRRKNKWHRVVFYRKLAEIAGEYLKKGRPVYVEGRLETRKWTDKQGSERYTTQIIADTMQMLGGKPGGSDQNDQASTPARASSKNSSGFEDMNEDIPF